MKRYDTSPYTNWYQYKDRLDVSIRIWDLKLRDKMCSESFIDEMSLQVSTLICRKANVSMNALKKRVDSILITESVHAIASYFNHDSWSYKFIELSDTIATIYCISIRWRSTNPQKDYIDPTQEIQPGDVQFELCYMLPREIKEIVYAKEKGADNYEILMTKPEGTEKEIQLISELAKMKTYIKAEKSGLRFDYEMCCGWPHVEMTLCFDSVTKELADKVQASFNEFISNWNKKQEKKHSNNYIHDAQIQPYDLKGTEIICGIDFGYSDPSTLKRMVRCLSDSDLPVQFIRLT